MSHRGPGGHRLAVGHRTNRPAPALNGPGAQENRMADDKGKRGGADRSRININEDYELRDWSEKWGVSADELRRAVQKVGPMADDVARELGKRV
jgi:hypothetical protein